MKTQEINSEDWQEFCEKFTEANRDSLLTIATIKADGIRSDLARDLPLKKMTFNTTDACNDIISISLDSEPDQRKINHFIIDPRHLRIRQSEEGEKFLEIGSENGVTLVTFHSGRFPDMKNFGEEKRFAIPS